MKVLGAIVILIKALLVLTDTSGCMEVVPNQLAR